jgi:hypothetical protein
MGLEKIRKRWENIKNKCLYVFLEIRRRRKQEKDFILVCEDMKKAGTYKKSHNVI